MGELPGYRGKALEALRKSRADIGDIIRIHQNGKIYEGLLIPRSEFHDDQHIVIKLTNGYNVGVLVTTKTKIEKTGKGSKPSFSTPALPRQKPNLPKVCILSTGGTIASRVNYRTGAVRPALTANDLYSVVPELSDLAKVEAEILFSILSENITPEQWSRTATQIASKIEGGAQGVVVAHGTDTMGYTAAALSFALQDLPVPVILVGSQRSADRPSSDAATNLIGAVKAATEAPFAEVVVSMHETLSDQSTVFHRGTKVRKCHTSRRDAFKSINTSPLARLEHGRLTMLAKSFNKRNVGRRLTVKPGFDERVALFKFYPNADAGVIDWLIDNHYRGIILEGTGLGHVGEHCFSALRKAVEENLIIGMTSQCIWGRTNMNVYDTGRDLLQIGIIPLDDMIPETALVKMMWALGQTKKAEDVKKLLTRNIAGEFSDRTLLENAGNW